MMLSSPLAFQNILKVHQIEKYKFIEFVVASQQIGYYLWYKYFIIFEFFDNDIKVLIFTKNHDKWNFILQKSLMSISTLNVDCII